MEAHWPRKEGKANRGPNFGHHLRRKDLLLPACCSMCWLVVGWMVGWKRHVGWMHLVSLSGYKNALEYPIKTKIQVHVSRRNRNLTDEISGKARFSSKRLLKTVQMNLLIRVLAPFGCVLNMTFFLIPHLFWQLSLPSDGAFSTRFLGQ